MKKRNLTLLACCIIFALVGSLTDSIYAQGCSDAGFCTVPGLKPGPEHIIDAPRNSIEVGISYGNADRSIAVVAPFLQYSLALSNQLDLSAKLTAIGQSGNDISVFGISDLYLTGNYYLSSVSELTLGVKIPLSDGNSMEDGLPLPMDYQSSLGTFDLIAGFGYRVGKLQLNAALQQPLSENENTFLAENYPESSPIREFQSTNQFVRKGDILVRASYPFAIGEALTLTPSVLPIYHLGNDEFTDENGVEREIEGSDGLTLNMNAYLDYRFGEKHLIRLSVGFPLVVRDVRPDGLTRSFVAGLSYGIEF